MKALIALISLALSIITYGIALVLGICFLPVLLIFALYQGYKEYNKAQEEMTKPKWKTAQEDLERYQQIRDDYREGKLAHQYK